MRIVYCIPEMSHPGGIGRVTAIKANYLAAQGHRVYIVTSNQFGAPMFYGLNPEIRYIDMGIGFQAGMDNRNPIGKNIKKRKKMKLYRKKLEMFLYDVRPDIVVSTFSNDSDFLYKINDGSKKVLENHFSHDGYKSQIKYAGLSFSHKLLLILRVWKQEYLAKKYDAFVVLTHEDAASWRGLKNLHVIPNMLSFKPSTCSSCQHKRVIAVGRLDFQKKFVRLIDLWAEAHKVCPDWRLDIFGEGPDEELLKERINAFGLSDVVSIHKPTKAIEEEYMKSSILCMTSTYEGWGLVLTEAMSCGIPCIAYACKCGPKDIIDNGVTGYCIEEDEKAEFVCKLVALMKDDEMRMKMGRSAIRNSEQYAVDSVMPLWIRLFDNLYSAKEFL